MFGVAGAHPEAHGADGGGVPPPHLRQRPHLPHQQHLHQQRPGDLPQCRRPQDKPLAPRGHRPGTTT